jgi:hypothetical protein
MFYPAPELPDDADRQRSIYDKDPHSGDNGGLENRG